MTGLGVVLALLLGTAGATAQEALLDRPVGADHLGPPVVWAPEAIGHGLWARRIAQGARVPVIFEAAPLMPFTGLPTRVDLTGLTVRQALDALVATDPRYAWRQFGRTVVIRPAAAWDDASHPLHRRAGIETDDNQPLAEAVRQVVEGEVIPAEMAALAASIDRGKRVARAADIRQTALVRLSGLAAEGELFLQVRDPRVSQGPFIDVATWNGHSYPIEVGATSKNAEEAGR
jgi:hypothetical protein